MIEYYSARANPYYLIYVSKLNWLYQKYFMNSQKTNDGSFKNDKNNVETVNE